MRAPPLLLAVVVLAAASQGQESQSASRPASPPGLALPDANTLDPPVPKGYRFVDNVIAMIGDKALLWSTIKEEVLSQVEGRVNAGERVTDSDRHEFAVVALENIVTKEILAQSARLSGPFTPTELNDRIAADLQLYLDEQVQRHGSFNQYMRELEAANKTWEDVAREHREEVLQSLTLASLRNRYRTGRSLVVTPREMRRFYEQNLARYRSEGGADLDRLAFQGLDARQRAAAAVTAWRAEPGQEASAVATKHGGTALKPLRGVGADSDALLPFLRDFAVRAKEGEVSDPIDSNGIWWVLRVQSKQTASSREFSDPEVQREIREELVRRSFNLEQHKLMVRNRGNLWIKVPPWLADR